MALQSNIKIYIAGVEILAYKSIRITQQIGAHHDVEMICRRDVLEEIVSDKDDNSQHFLGQALLISVSSVDTISSYKDLQWKGVVTEVQSTKGFLHQKGDLITFIAKSNTIVADDGPNYASFMDLDVGSIVDKVFQRYDRSKLTSVIKPKFSEPIHYSVQNGESAFEYVGRLADQYGEWFYDDGQQIIFGAPQADDVINVTYGWDLQEFSLSLHPISNNYNFFTNDYLNDEQHQINTAKTGASLNGYNGLASQKSKELYPHTTRIFLNTYNDPKIKQRVDVLVANQKQAEEVKQVVLKGKSDNPGVSVGRVINIKDNDATPGKFRITKVIHDITENGKYINDFEGISVEQDISPNTDIRKFPRSDNQVAIVTDNADPDGLSRIQVQFPWQKPLSEHTPWLRVLTPHSGGEKGFHFIPEIGEEVLIGFEGGNAERPFVLGTLYHGNANSKSWNTQNNDVKAIRTRSGHTIELNDAHGSEFITITDKNQNLINIDTANNNITITALENMTLNAKNMDINVEEDMNINVGKNKKENIGQNHTVNTSNSIEFASQTKSVNVNLTYMQSAGSASIITLAGDLTMHAKGISTLQGNADVKISKG